MTRLPPKINSPLMDLQRSRWHWRPKQLSREEALVPWCMSYKEGSMPSFTFSLFFQTDLVKQRVRDSALFLAVPGGVAVAGKLTSLGRSGCMPSGQQA